MKKDEKNQKMTQFLSFSIENVEIPKNIDMDEAKRIISIYKEKFEIVCKRWRAGEITAKKAMEILKLKPNTFYRRVKEMQI